MTLTNLPDHNLQVPSLVVNAKQGYGRNQLIGQRQTEVYLVVQSLKTVVKKV